MGSDNARRDGSLDFSGGVNSIAVTTVDVGPASLQRNQLAWLNNATVRDGGISPRAGWLYRATIALTDCVQVNYYLTFTAAWNVPAIGSNVTVVLTESYPGSNGDQGVLFGKIAPDLIADIATIEIISGAGTTSITVKILISDYVGTSVNASPEIHRFLVTSCQHPGSDYLFQGKFIYDPFGDTDPYEIWVVSGNILKVDVNTGAVVNLSAQFGLVNSATSPFAFFVQAEEFLIIQSGDGVTLPLFWDGVTLRRSKGITTNVVAPGTPGVNEIPAATTMEYYMLRVWYAEGRVFSAGDIVYSNSGTAAYNFRDAVLNVTENPLAVGGDGFPVPLQDGNIRALRSGAAIDAALGQGRLFIGTRKAWYSLQVPVTRANWIAADKDNMPLLTVVQLVNGPVNDRSCVTVNGDIWHQSLEPGIRSLDQSVRFFSQPGNRQISANETRLLQFNDRALMRASSGIVFNNRLLETALPRQTPQGIVSDALAVMDFIPISTFSQERQPNWEGSSSGLAVFQLVSGDFGGRERAFAAVRSEEDGSLQLWELSQNEKLDKFTDGARGNRVEWFVELPAFTWQDSIGLLELKKLVGAELWIDRLEGTVELGVDYRPNSSTCWLTWINWSECSPRNTAESLGLPVTYPVDNNPCYKTTLILPKPDPACQPCANNYPANIGLQFQPRLRIKGNCRVRAFWMWAEPVERGIYQPSLVC